MNTPTPLRTLWPINFNHSWVIPNIGHCCFNAKTDNRCSD